VKGAHTDRNVLVHVGQTEYRAITEMKSTKAECALALIGWLPIDEVHLVEGDPKSQDQETNDKVMKALEFLKKVSSLPIMLTNV
jgi:hypothetical protein